MNGVSGLEFEVLDMGRGGASEGNDEVERLASAMASLFSARSSDLPAFAGSPGKT